ncbi:MAG: hypothetical protein JWN48_4748 [Myxococcaceae bacterium]|nr:hypothetical protein [Myxococcaceae bacterium]
MALPLFLSAALLVTLGVWQRSSGAPPQGSSGSWAERLAKPVPSERGEASSRPSDSRAASAGERASAEGRLDLAGSPPLEDSFLTLPGSPTATVADAPEPPRASTEPEAAVADDPRDFMLRTP